MSKNRRQALAYGLGLAAAPLAAKSAQTAPPANAASNPSPADGAKRSSARWSAGVEGQRRADLGDGNYRNPVLAGDQPDPSVLKDGSVYYKVSSSFVYYPGLVVWRSTDLVNWAPVGPALRTYVGSVYAPDLVKHEGRYYIYFAARWLPRFDDLATGPSQRKTMATYVVHAPSIAGPWSEPVDVGVNIAIDPGHVVGEDGKRYLYVSDGALVPLSDDGLKATGAAQKLYDGWKYPADWIVENFALEGPKLLRRDGWYYMFSAEGGTGGPPTSHMVVVARSRSVRGPWENCPHNPIVRTASASEPWWSRGHATAVEGPGGDWWLIYHGYENGYRTLGRQMLLEPMSWTADGWPKAKGGDLSKPLPKPRGGRAGPHGVAFSGPFKPDDLGARLAYYMPSDGWAQRARWEDGALILAGQGTKPSASSPLVLDVGDHRYELTVELDLKDGGQAGLLLFYDERFFCGLIATPRRLAGYKMGAQDILGTVVRPPATRMFLRVVNRDNVASFSYSWDGLTWALHSAFEVAGYNHNVADGFLSLRPALFAAGKGSVSFKSLTYRALA